MPTTFGRELLGRDVLDASSDKLGTMADFSLDMDTGSIAVSYTHLTLPTKRIV